MPHDLVVVCLVKLPVIKIPEDLPTLLHRCQVNVELPCVLGVVPAEGIIPERKQQHNSTLITTMAVRPMATHNYSLQSVMLH